MPCAATGRRSGAAGRSRSDACCCVVSDPTGKSTAIEIAPQVGGVIERRRARARSRCSRPPRAGRGPGRAYPLSMLPRGAPARWCDANAFVVTTGPGHGRVLETNPALRSLAAKGWIGRQVGLVWPLMDGIERSAPAASRPGAARRGAAGARHLRRTHGPAAGDPERRGGGRRRSAACRGEWVAHAAPATVSQMPIMSILIVDKYPERS